MRIAGIEYYSPVVEHNDVYFTYYFFPVAFPERFHLRRHVTGAQSYNNIIVKTYSKALFFHLMYYTHTHIHRCLRRRITLWCRTIRARLLTPPGNFIFPPNIKDVIAQKSIYLFPFFRGDLSTFKKSLIVGAPLNRGGLFPSGAGIRLLFTTPVQHNNNIIFIMCVLDLLFLTGLKTRTPV